MPGVFPDYPAPVLRNTDTGRELAQMRWGMPPPRTGGPPVTNIRSTSLPHWRGWLKPENRCLVPANSFAEYVPVLNPETKKKDVVWFALNEDRPLFAFAGIWTEYRGDRGTKSKPIPGPHLVYGFRTSVPNAIVEPIHPKAMPVRLRVHWAPGIPRAFCQRGGSRSSPTLRCDAVTRRCRVRRESQGGPDAVARHVEILRYQDTDRLLCMGLFSIFWVAQAVDVTGGGPSAKPTLCGVR
jgi:hypothetical protein